METNARKFYKDTFIGPEEILRYLESAGFKNIYHKRMTFGVVYLYCAQKP